MAVVGADLLGLQGAGALPGGAGEDEGAALAGAHGQEPAAARAQGAGGAVPDEQDADAVEQGAGG